MTEIQDDEVNIGVSSSSLVDLISVFRTLQEFPIVAFWPPVNSEEMDLGCKRVQSLGDLRLPNQESKDEEPETHALLPFQKPLFVSPDRHSFNNSPKQKVINEL